jgi:hypothetical protein
VLLFESGTSPYSSALGVRLLKLKQRPVIARHLMELPKYSSCRPTALRPCAPSQDDDVLSQLSSETSATATAPVSDACSALTSALPSMLPSPVEQEAKYRSASISF